jgi:hypothetical protein
LLLSAATMIVRLLLPMLPLLMMLLLLVVMVLLPGPGCGNECSDGLALAGHVDDKEIGIVVDNEIMQPCCAVARGAEPLHERDP